MPARGAAGSAAAAAATAGEGRQGGRGEGAGGGLPPSERPRDGEGPPLAPVPSPRDREEAEEGEDIASRASGLEGGREERGVGKRRGEVGEEEKESESRAVVGQFLALAIPVCRPFRWRARRASSSAFSRSLSFACSVRERERNERTALETLWRCASWRREPATAARPTGRAGAAMPPRWARQTLSGASPTPCWAAPPRRTRGRMR